jgi:glycosyltransferase involved in cell wall biosynthesis
VILDDNSTNPKTLEALNQVACQKDIFVHKHSLDNNYSEHKNFGTKQCSGDWVFQIDGDELPSDTLIYNIRDIININNNVELIYVPRINDFIGVTEDHAKQWGWQLTHSSLYNRPIVNWPDFQSRLYKRDYPRIKWDRRLHEKIIGYTKYAFLPDDEEFALYHDKTIEKQIETNQRYNKDFSVDDNKGHTIN